MNRTGLAAAGMFAAFARLATGGEAYDDREVMKRAGEVAQALVRAIPRPREVERKAGDFKKDPFKVHLAEIESIARTLRSASKQGGPGEVRGLRTAVAGRARAFAGKVSSYAASGTSFASLAKQLKVLEKTKPKC